MSDPTDTQDATQTGATDDTTTETVELSARERAMEAIANQRMGSFDAENKDGQQSAEQTTQDAQIAAQMGNNQLTSLDEQVVKVKIDGVESQVTVAEMRRQYQKNGAAERRLEEATRLLNEARATAKQEPDSLRFGETEKKTDSDADEEVKSLVTALFEGDESKAFEVFKKAGIGRSPDAPILDVDQIAAQIAPAIRQQLFEENALEQFSVEFKDIVADPYLADLADTFLDAEVASGTPYDKALKQAGLKTRDWLASKGVTPPEPNPTIDRNTKLERKAGIDTIPALNSKATTVEVPEPSASDVIREMRKARGLEV